MRNARVPFRDDGNNKRETGRVNALARTMTNVNYDLREDGGGDAGSEPPREKAWKSLDSVNTPGQVGEGGWTHEKREWGG